MNRSRRNAGKLPDGAARCNLPPQNHETLAALVEKSLDVIADLCTITEPRRRCGRPGRACRPRALAFGPIGLRTLRGEDSPHDPPREDALYNGDLLDRGRGEVLVRA
jgi:hypothetical protein